ncbi:LacI family DNA-binding transcriptional regulator [Sphingomonas sp. LHG3406-1]|uniref:LacI family DNA-binding transcriptional regulator n=1 Tax=Sphingomonas sp. LHG3406-1 TaxID=2804617 RepID=UPI002612D1F6|nr:substrate-binding domain-containing protein [Sphingomonas sp. LHG3406-1]
MAKSHTVGVLLPDLHGEFFSELLRGMDLEANRRGYLLLFSNLHAGSSQGVAALRAMRGKVDGLVVMAPHLNEVTIAQVLPPSMRAVLINAPGDVRSHSNIRVDNHVGVQAVVAHLRELGRQRIAYIGGPSDNIDAQERAAAFSAAAGESESALMRDGDFSVESGELAIRHLLEEGVAFDSVFAANDMMALGVLRGLEAAGRRVPSDIAVAGFDDVPLASYLHLTTVRVGIAELARRALGLLIDELADPARPLTAERHTPTLVERQTTVGS